MEVKGADDIDRIVRNIRTHADAKAIRREMYRGLNSVSKGVREEMLGVIPNALPRRGGLAAQIAGRARARTTAKSGKYAGVSIRFSARGTDMRLLTGRRLRHPLFGNRSVWIEQTEGVDPEAFPEAFDKQRPEITRAVVAVMDDIARKVTE